MTRHKAFFTVLVVFFVSVLVRLPNINRPVSKHHEFITALILINIESWRQGGGGDKFHYIPVMNFQNPGDKDFSKDVYLDSKGDRWYLSLGPGWYILPYFIYELFHLPTIPIYLRALNLLFNLLSVILFFYFCERLLPATISNRYQLIIASCFLFIFTPGTLWYFGNGYVHNVIMLPFLIGALILLFDMFMSAEKIKFSRLFSLGLLIILLMYFDWFIFFASFFSVILCIGKIKYDKKYFWLSGTLVAAAAIGAILIFLQFASYDGADAVMGYWKDRFLFRSITNEKVSFFRMIIHLSFHSITAFFPLLALLVISLLWSKFKKININFSKNEILFFILFAGAALLYNLVLLEWSYEHEFSILPWSVLFAYVGARLCMPLLTKKNIYPVAAIFFLATITQYYFINRPGKISRDGMPYDTFKLFGEQLKQVPPDYKIFSPLEKPAMMIDYYAGRNITIQPTYEEARKNMQENGIHKAVWVEQNDYRFKKIIIIQ